MDRAAFDFALEHGIEIGGYVPKGRFSENGPIPDKYANLIETDSDDPAERTRQNVLFSEATLIVSHGGLYGGSALTKTIAEAVRKPCLSIDLEILSLEKAGITVQEWLEKVRPQTLNVAGPRASEDPTIYKATYDLLSAFFPD